MNNSQSHQWIVSPRQRYDLEMLSIGGFESLNGFLSQNDYENVLTKMRLANGKLWPIPVTLDVNDKFAQQVKIGDTIQLCDHDKTILAAMIISDKWQPNKREEAIAVFGTEDESHAGVDYLFNQVEGWYLGGIVTHVQTPKHFDFNELRYTPEMLKKIFANANWRIARTLIITVMAANFSFA